MYVFIFYLNFIIIIFVLNKLNSEHKNTGYL